MFRLISIPFLIALFYSMGPALGESEKVPENLVEIDNELSMAFETPHTKWAKPYALGPTRVLFFAPWYQGSTDGREIIELMQRFDLHADGIFVMGEYQQI